MPGGRIKRQTKLRTHPAAMYALSTKFHHLKNAIQKLGAGIHSGTVRNYRRLQDCRFEVEAEDEGFTAVDNAETSGGDGSMFNDDTQSGKYQKLGGDIESDELDGGKETDGRNALVFQTKAGEVSHSETRNYQRLEECTPSDEEDGGQEWEEDGEVNETAGSKEGLSTLGDHHGNELVGYDREDYTKHDTTEEDGLGAANTTETPTQRFNRPVEEDVPESCRHDDGGTENINGISNPIYQPSCGVDEGSELLLQVSDFTPQSTDVDCEHMPFLPDVIPADGDTDRMVQLEQPDEMDTSVRLTAADESPLIQSRVASVEAEVCTIPGDQEDHGAVNPVSAPRDQRRPIGSNNEEPGCVDEVDLINFQPQHWLNSEILDGYSVPHKH